MIICHIGSFNNNTPDSVRESKAIGGISGYVFDLINFLLKSNHQIIFIGRIYSYKPNEKLRYIEIQNNITSTNKFLLTLFIKSLFIRISNNTIIHAHRPDHFAVFAWFRKNPGILTLHGQQSKTVNSRKGFFVKTFYNWLEYMALKKVRIVIATDKITKNYYIERYDWLRTKIRIIPTGIDLNEFFIMDKQDCRSRLNINSQAKIVMYIGRIEPPKRIEDIILSFQIVHQEFSNTKLIIIGDGVLLPSMKLLTEKLNLQDCVLFTGPLKRQELPVWINSADVTVLYSNNEGSPLSVKESLACGIPVIGNPVGDISEIIINGINGYLLEKDDNFLLSSLIKKSLYNSTFDPVSCMKSIAKYSIDSINHDIELMYNQL